MEDLARTAGRDGRIALGVDGDDPAANRAVIDFIDTVGFDALAIGTVAHSVTLKPETPLFGAALPASACEETLTAAAL